MAMRLSAKEAAERALRRIGAFSINDVSADPAELEEALIWMDMNVSELAGTEQCLWLVDDTIDLPLTADTQTYDLDEAGSDYPSDGLVSVVSVWIRDSSGNDEEVEMIRRNQWESIVDKDASGTPDKAYIDRTVDVPTISIYPVPSDSTYTLRIVVRKFAVSMLGSGTSKPGKLDHNLPIEWQKWLVLSTAAEIGAGPVRRLPTGEVQEIRAGAESSKAKLIARANVETTSKRRTAAWGV
ncbi:MAG: hypothetical protein EG825_00405 [Rhodocyclaceae bacterium]|nr:hypothetical protein [Rhodocyclaceae bacterium]